VVKKLDSVGYELFAHQVDGVRWMLEHEMEDDYASVGILADDMGLGKTIQSCSLWLGNPCKTLIIVPVTTISQWLDALNTFCPDAKVRVHHGGGKFRYAREVKEDRYDICLAGYNATFDSDVECNFRKTLLHEITWGRVILDEGHKIRNRGTKMSRGCRKIKATNRWILTGTPLQNSRKDLETLLMFLGFNLASVISSFDYLCDTYLLRRNRDIVKDKYTELDVEIVNVPFQDPNELKFYQNLRTECKDEYLRLKREGDGNIMMQLFELLLRLRQATIHPNLVINGLAKKYEQEPDLWDGESSKMKELVKLFNAQDDGDKTIVFCHFTEEINLVIGTLGRTHPDLRVEKFDGSMNLGARDDVLQRSKKDKVDVIVMQILCGSVGLNMQEFNNVYIVSGDWNPSNEMQAIGRAHRIGQTRNVHVKKLVSTEPPVEDNDEMAPVATIDERILQIQENKRELMVEFLKDEIFRDNGRMNNDFKSALTMKDYSQLLGGK
jgi:SNF2 family DNA or RNA helicase